MRFILIFFFTRAIATTTLAALPLSAQLSPSAHSFFSQSSRGCSSGIAEVGLIISGLRTSREPVRQA
jgi:hypothetical protein